MTSLYRLCRTAALALLLAPATFISAQTAPRLIGYFGQWGLYNQPASTLKDLVTSGNAARLDQLNYAQGFVTDGHCSIADPNADLNFTFAADQSVDGIADIPGQPLRGYFNQLIKLKRKYPKLKLVLSLEGRAPSFAADAQPDTRQAFVASCVDLFLKGNLAPGLHEPALFDGIDIDWEYPHDEDAANFTALLAEFRRQLDLLRPGLLLDIAVGPSPRMVGGADIPALAAAVDHVGVMTYDFNGPWNKRTGFLAPFPSAAGGTRGSLLAWQQAGIPAAKLLMGLPFYGYGWHQVTEDNNGLNQEGEPIRGDRPYRDIQALIPGSTVFRDPDSQEPWLFDGDIFWTYEDPISVRHKAAFIRDGRFGGLMIWELGDDTPTGTLLQAAYEGLHTVSLPTTTPTLSQLTRHTLPHTKVGSLDRRT